MFFSVMFGDGFSTYDAIQMQNFPLYMPRKKNSVWCLAMRHSPSENSDPLWVWDGAGVQFLHSFVHNTRGYGSFVFTHLSASSNKYHIKSKTFMHMDASLCFCVAHIRDMSLYVYSHVRLYISSPMRRRWKMIPLDRHTNIPPWCSCKCHWVWCSA